MNMYCSMSLAVGISRFVQLDSKNVNVIFPSPSIITELHIAEQQLSDRQGTARVSRSGNGGSAPWDAAHQPVKVAFVTDHLDPRIQSSQTVNSS